MLSMSFMFVIYHMCMSCLWLKQDINKDSAATRGNLWASGEHFVPNIWYKENQTVYSELFPHF